MSGVSLLDEPTRQIIPTVLSALAYYLETVFDGGGKNLPSSEQVGRLTKVLNARRRSGSQIEEYLALSYLSTSLLYLCLYALDLYVTGQWQPDLKGPRYTYEGKGQQMMDRGLPMRDRVHQ